MLGHHPQTGRAAAHFHVQTLPRTEHAAPAAGARRSVERHTNPSGHSGCVLCMAPGCSQRGVTAGSRHLALQGRATSVPGGGRTLPRSFWGAHPSVYPEPSVPREQLIHGPEQAQGLCRPDGPARDPCTPGRCPGAAGQQRPLSINGPLHRCMSPPSACPEAVDGTRLSHSNEPMAQTKRPQEGVPGSAPG